MKGFWIGLSLCAIVLAMALPARADVSWAGAGWYITYTETGFDIELSNGPFASQTDCQDARAADHSHDSDPEGVSCD